MERKRILPKSFISKSKDPLPNIPSKYFISPKDFTVTGDRPIGVGGCSSVFLGTFNGSAIAIKCYNVANPENSPAREMLLKETEAIVSLDHANIIKCLGVCLQKGSLLLELAKIDIEKNGKSLTVYSLRELIDAVGESIESDVRNECLYQILEGLQYLHSKSIIHGDLKSANVLVNELGESYQFKLTDFGGSHARLNSTILSNISSIQSNKEKPGTTSFEAPEVFNPNSEKTSASDVYSFGMIMHEFLYYMYSHPWESVYKQCYSGIGLASLIISSVKQGERPKIEEDSPFTEIMRCCWKQDPADRPTVTALKLNIKNLEIEDENNGHISNFEDQNTTIESSGITGVSARRKLEFSDKISDTDALDSSTEMAEERNDDELIASDVSDSLIEDVASNSPSMMQPVSPKPVIESEPSTEITPSTIEDCGGTVHSQFALQRKTDIIEDEIMKWQGYAMQYLKVTLKDFQLEAIHAYSCGKDCIVIQATGAGKSTCFNIPALLLTNRDFGLVIVPTVGLGWDHHEAFKDMGVESVFINGTSTIPDYDKAFKSASRAAKVIIVNPESLFGDETNSGILDRLLAKADLLKFIAIDEAHLIFDWSGFRSTFGDVKKLKKLFPSCPKIALSATLKPEHVQAMQKDVLKNPVTIVGMIDRPNVSLNVLTYKKASATEVKKQNSDTWDSTCKQIEQLIDGEKAIVYCSYASECKEICFSLNKRNVKAYVYTGKNSSAEKREVYHKMKNNEIDLVIATKAFGLGINIPDIRHVVHLGLPENLSLWIQEFGRAGRDGKQAHAHLLICEYEDFKKLNYWINNCATQEERRMRLTDFVHVWKYMSKLYTGDCLREFHHQFFEEKSVSAPALRTDDCCTGCQIRSGIPIEPNEKLPLVLQTLSFLKDNKITRVYEKQLLAWMSGKEENWMWLFFDAGNLEGSTYGCLKETPESVLKLVVKATLRQCLSLDYVLLEFSLIPGTKNLAKFWSLSSQGIKIATGDLKAPSLPDPLAVASRLSSNDDDTDTPQVKRKKKGDQMTNRIMKMLDSGPSTWIILERKEQYELLGFHHDTSKLLYVKDYTELKGCPAKPLKDYLWDDINLSKKQGFPIFKFQFKENEAMASNSDESSECTMSMYRSRCSGVKMCEGDTGKSCQFSVHRRVHNNRCLNHPNAKLIESGPCGGHFVYIRPLADDDKRRWLGFVSAEGTKSFHAHPCPVRSKLGSKLQQGIEEAVKIDPSKTASEISKGMGMPCNPASISAVASNIDTLSNCVKKAKKNLYSGANDRYIVENFNILIKNAIDEKDAKHAENEESANEILKACSPYCRFSHYGESFNYCILATPQMLEVLNEAMVIEADVTFPGAKSFPYVLNMVSFNYETLIYQAVARVLMTSLTVSAYKEVFGKVLELTTNLHPEFENGKDVKGWIVDFSLAQRQGLESNLADKANFIRGCDVHYKRGVKKIADKVAEDEPSKSLFKKIAHSIPNLESGDHVKIAFEILCGKFDLVKGREFLLTKIKCWPQEIDNANNQGWGKAAAWADWWGQPKVTQMFTKSFTEMTEAEWAACPKTTNAVESQNKKGSSKTKSFRDVVTNFYLEDKALCFSTLAAREGIKTGTPIAKRQVQNEKRRLRRDRPRLLEVEDSASTTPSMAAEKPAKKRKVAPKAPAQEAPSATDDDNVGRTVWIDTYGPRGKSYGWCKATIIKKKDDGYVAKYISDKKTTYIPNILDEKFVRFYSNEEMEA